MARGSTLKYSKKFTATPAPAVSKPKAPSPRATGGTPTAPSSTTAPTRPTTTRRVLTQQEAGQIAQETFRTRVQTLTAPIRKKIQKLTINYEDLKAQGGGRTPDFGARVSAKIVYDQILNEEEKIKKMEDCGIIIAKSPAEIGKTLLNKLSN